MNQPNGKTLLIVDDQEVNRAILANIFEPEYRIMEADDGLTGLAAIQAYGPSICAVLLDVVMPRMNGIQVLRKLYQDGLIQTIPIFLITADVAGSVMREAYELGVMDVIFKPVVPYLVRRRVNSVVELFQARRRLGAELLSRIPQMREHSAYDYAYDIALHHHERWDGGGYPDGLRGNEIAIWTQVVSLADVYNALVSCRCYKESIPFPSAVDMILDGQCGVFNPALLACFRREEPVLRRFYHAKGANTHG